MKPRSNISGIFAIEQQIMDHWDAGRSIERIAEIMPQSREYISKVVSRFSVPAEREFKAMAAKGSDMLLATIQRYVAQHQPEARL
jgi:hypothetical protein